MAQADERLATTGSGIAALVIGIVALVGSYSGPPGMVLAAIGLAYGYDGRRQVRQGLRSGGGLATAGLVLGWLALAFSSIQLLALFR